MPSEIKTSNKEKTPIAIGKENVDIRVVKCWYQAGTELSIKDKLSKTLTPELLLKDDSIVQVNHEYQVNLVKNLDAVQDSLELKPFVLEMQENKQIWLTVHIPNVCSLWTYAELFYLL